MELEDRCGSVLLGHIGKPAQFFENEIPPGNLSKIGGHPVWLHSTPKQYPYRCKSCGQYLDLICQISTPYAKAERCLYVFGCHKKPRCSLDVHNWTVLRAVIPENICKTAEEREQLIKDGNRTEEKILCNSTLEREDDICTFEANSFKGLEEKCSDWKNSSNDWLHNISRDMFEDKFQNKSERRRKNNETFERKKNSYENGDLRVGKQSLFSQSGAVRDPNDIAIFLPSYFIEIEEEPQCEIWSFLDDRVHALWEEYTKREGGDEEFEESRTGQHISGSDTEEYESSKDKTFHAFQRRLSIRPHQILRYSFGGRPLWMNYSAKKSTCGDGKLYDQIDFPPPPCPQCGAERCFEMQLMPSLIYEINLRCANIKEHRECFSSDSGWGTICIFTCSEDCFTPNVYYYEEYAIVEIGF